MTQAIFMRTAKTLIRLGGLPRLIWVFAGHTCHFVGFVMRRLNCVTQDNCLTSRGKPCDAEQLPLWQNFLSAPHNHYRFWFSFMSIFIVFRFENVFRFHIMFVSFSCDFSDTHILARFKSHFFLLLQDMILRFSLDIIVISFSVNTQ